MDNFWERCWRPELCAVGMNLLRRPATILVGGGTRFPTPSRFLGVWGAITAA